MLKIKDNIDFETLKKYGFKKVYDIDTGELDHYVYEYNQWHYIWIIPDTKMIDVYDSEDLGQQAIEKFYDLMKDNLVDKVEEAK